MFLASLGLALSGLPLTAPTAHAQTQAATQGANEAKRAYNIAAGPLERVLTAFAHAADVELAVDAALIQGKTSKGLSGSYSVNEGFAELLRGHALQLVRGAGGAYSLRADGASSTSAAGAAGLAAAATLPTVLVNGARDSADGPVNGYVARRSRSGTKTDTALIEIPQSISVIGRTEIEARGAQDLMDVVALTPGIAVNPYGPDNRGWEYVSLRGFSGNTSSFRDGLPQSQFGVIYRMTELYGLERVEVLRGPGSVMFGQGEAGGVINRVSKLAGDESIKEIELQYGSFDRKQLAFDLGDKFSSNEDLSYRLLGVALDSNDQDRYPDGQKINRTRYALAPSLRWRPNASTSLTLLGEFIKNDSGEDPYYAIAGDGSLSRVKMGDPSYSRFRQNQASLGYQFEHHLNDAWSVRQNFRYTDITLDRRVVWVDSLQADGHTYSRGTRTWDDSLKQTSLDTQLQGKLQTGVAAHTLLFGVDWNYLDGDALRFRGTAPDLDLLNPVYGLNIPAATTPLANFNQTMSQIGLYAQDQIKIDERWLLTIGGRQDYVRTRTDNHLSASNSSTQNDSMFSGRLGLGYLFGNGWSPYLSYAESFLPSSGLDADNHPFKPSRGKQLEAGIKFQPEASRSLFTAAVFDLRKTNTVTYDNLTGDARQIGKQRSRGLELEAKTEITPRLNAVASMTWLAMKVLESADSTEVGKVPATIPRQTAAIWLDYEAGGGFGLGGGVNYVGVRQNDEANTTAEGGFALASAMLRYELGPWRFRLNASNLFNRKYNSICYHGECYLGAERNLTATIRYRF
ncbi:TonB-dependent siderophore receptor [Herbaspirillum lusitanum]|uniref:TonB-dependent siderophore receptor n=1 Tax=Herbaspirillum lusitanum TaxID=213312 RepID=A0ABW9AAE8_9BURK